MVDVIASNSLCERTKNRSDLQNHEYTVNESNSNIVGTLPFRSLVLCPSGTGKIGFASESDVSSAF